MGVTAVDCIFGAMLSEVQGTEFLRQRKWVALQVHAVKGPQYMSIATHVVRQVFWVYKQFDLRVHLHI